MILEHINYLAVAVSAVAYFMVGSVWFTPIGFGKAWMKGHGIVMPDDATAQAQMRKEMPMLFGKTFVLCFVASLSVACLQGAIDTSSWMAGAKLGLACGAFVFVGFTQSHMYTRKSFQLAIIDSGYHVIGLTIAGIILTLWR
ncbi:MAG TPA: DUF1761 domain-containing protein [Bacteroidia bacterium]|nr:DUF1761 domain-containing protein [Bacteroidia bacterium]